MKYFPSLECIIVSRGPCCLLKLIKNSEEDFQCFICEHLSWSKIVDCLGSSLFCVWRKKLGGEGSEGPGVVWV